MLFYLTILSAINLLTIGWCEVQICEVCTCSEISDVESGGRVVFNIQCTELDKTENLGDLDKLQWPGNVNSLAIVGAFEGLGLSTIGKLPHSRKVESLSFSNNAIKTYWPDPFSQLPNLKRLTISQNDLAEITPDLFTNIDHLEFLDLSYNKLSDFNILDFKRLKAVKKLNLQSNKLRKVPVDALRYMTSLEELDVSKNGIYDFALTTHGYQMNTLKILHMSGNKIRSVVKNAFPEANKLEYLDLSNNVIEIVEHDAFIVCPNLRELNLAQNNITVTFDLPFSLQVATLRINSLHAWPWFPSGIKHIDIAYNKLDQLFDENVIHYSSLEYLNIAGNRIEKFDISNKLPMLLSLDLSYNMLTGIPDAISTSMFPSLHELRLDGNPIESVFFENTIQLESLYLSELEVEVVKANAFSKVEPKVIAGFEENCFSLTLSNCQELSEIEKGAFDGTSLCMLDISNNNLSHLPRELLDWSSLTDGANLQFNPWDCGCHLQWVLDELMPHLIGNNSRLLAELRCASPRAVEGIRLVHFYNWTQKALCDSSILSSGPRDNLLLDSPSQDEQLSSVTLILIAGIAVGLLVIVVLIVHLVRNKKRYRLRKASVRKKRQSDRDAKDANGSQKEQFVALNKL